MSAYSQIYVYCDHCGEEYAPVMTKVSTLRAARKEAQELGWRTGVKPTDILRPRYSSRCDICPNCIRKRTQKSIPEAKYWQEACNQMFGAVRYAQIEKRAAELAQAVQS